MADINLLSSGIGNSSPTKNSAASVTVNTTGAELIVIGVSTVQSKVITLTNLVGGLSSTFTALTTQNTGTGGQFKLFYSYLPVNTGASHSFTVAAQADLYGTIMVMCFDGLAISSAFDTSNGQAPNVGPYTSGTPGSITVAQDNSLIITGICSHQNKPIDTIGGGFTVPSGMSQIIAGTNLTCAMAYYVKPTSGAINPTWTIPNSLAATNNYACAIASFKGQPLVNGNFFLFF